MAWIVYVWTDHFLKHVVLFKDNQSAYKNKFNGLYTFEQLVSCRIIVSFLFFPFFKYLHFPCSLFKLSLQVKLSAMFFHRKAQVSIKMATHNIFGSIHLWLVQIRVKPSYHWDALILLKQDTSKSSFSMLVRYRKIHWIILPQICWRYPTFILCDRLVI